MDEQYYINKINEMIRLYHEKRSDVADNLQNILDGKPLTEAEHRFAKVKIPEGVTEVIYDTYTTLFEFYNEDEVTYETPFDITYED